MVKIPLHFKKFLKEEQFILTAGKIFGRVDIYSDGSLILRLVKDYNSFKSIEISSKNDINEWHSLSVIRSYVLGNNDFFHPLDFEVGINFFIEHYNEICSLLNEGNYDLTIRKLKEILIKRNEFRKW